jgi:putative addiction module component (TIGR02574 family)
LSPTIESVEADALALSPEERAELIERLGASLDMDPDVDAAWAVEIKRRLRDIENGTATYVPGPQAMAEIKSLLT